jgi:hypothetical protein
LAQEFFCLGRLGSQGSKEKKLDLRNSEGGFFNFLWAKKFFFKGDTGKQALKHIYQRFFDF